MITNLHSYESILIINELNENSNVKNDNIRKILIKNGCTITNVENWGIKKLAYPIEKNGIKSHEGFYATYFFVSEPENVKKLQKELENYGDVIKFIMCDTTNKWNN